VLVVPSRPLLTLFRVREVRVCALSYIDEFCGHFSWCCMYDCSCVAMNMNYMLGVMKCSICACVNSGGSCFSRPNDLSRLSKIKAFAPFCLRELSLRRWAPSLSESTSNLSEEVSPKRECVTAPLFLFSSPRLCTSLSFRFLYDSIKLYNLFLFGHRSVPWVVRSGL